VTPDKIPAEVRQIQDLMSWGVFRDERTGLFSLLDPLLESSSLSQSKSELLATDSQSVSQSNSIRFIIILTSLLLLLFQIYYYKTD